MTEKPPDTEEKKITIKNSDIEVMRRGQARTCGKCGDVAQQASSIEWLSSCRDLPTGFAFELKKMVLRIRSIEIPFDQQRQVLIEKHADRDEKGELAQVSPNVFSFRKNPLPFQREFSELLDLKSGLDCGRLEICLEDLPDRLLSADDFAALECIIEFIKEKRDG